MRQKAIKVTRCKILTEDSLMYHDSDRSFAKANTIQLEKLLVNMLHQYTIKEIRQILTKLNKKAA